MIGAAAFAMLLFNGGIPAAQTSAEAKRGQRAVQEALDRLVDRGALPSANARRMSTPAAAKTLRAFGHCIMMFPGRAVDILDTLPGSVEEHQITADVAHRRAGCLNSGTLTFGAPLLRGLVAESLLNRDFGGVGGGRRHDPVPIYAMPQMQDRTDFSSQVRALLQLQDFAGCVLGSASDKVAALLASQPASDEEGRAWQGLSGVMNACIDPHQQFKMSALQLRGALAEAAYRSSVQRAAAMREVGAMREEAKH